MAYLDYNATTPVDPRVIDVMMDVYINHTGNAGSRTHFEGDSCRRIVEQARKEVAHLADINPDNVIFTSGATESDNLAVGGLAEYGLKTGRTHVLVSCIEHKAVLNVAKSLEERGFIIEYVPVMANGVVSVDEVLGRIRDNTLVVSIMHVNNETGVIQPVREIGDAIRRDYPEVYFHIDAAQSFGKLVDEVKSLAYDMLSVSAHKMYGPQGIGALLLRTKDYTRPPIAPLLFGGEQEMGLRSGTLPVALIAGFGKACALCENGWQEDQIVEQRVLAGIFEALEASGISYKVNGSSDHRVPNCLNISFEDVSSEALMIASRHSVSVSNGSACTSDSYEPSYVLMSMNVGRARAKSAVRLSWGRFTDYNETMRAIESLIEAARGLQ